jgi:hypothetical protein
MSDLDSRWLSIWEWCGSIGFLLVILGCVIEGVEHFIKFKRGESPKRKGIEKIGWLILVAGLAMEFIGDKRAKRISDRENRRLSVEAAEARKDAGKANERAAHLESTNLLFRSNVVVLEAAVQWRTVTPAQESNLVGLLKPFADEYARLTNSVQVHVEETDVEARWYAKRIVDVLRRCGFNSELKSAIGFSNPEAPIPLGLGFIEGGFTPTPHMIAVIKAFDAANLEVRVRQLNTNQTTDGILHIWVWHKPER